jgi:hypothetical protein
LRFLLALRLLAARFFDDDTAFVLLRSILTSCGTKSAKLKKDILLPLKYRVSSEDGRSGREEVENRIDLLAGSEAL